MSQSVFLLFDRGARLTRVTVTATTHGSVDPYSMFFEAGADSGGHRALELDPRIIEKIRPEVWQRLVGHAVYTTEGLQVDELEVIQRREEEVAVAQAEVRVLDLAGAFAHLQAAVQLLGEMSPTAERLAGQRGRDLESAQERLAGLRSRSIPVTLNQVLTDLAGKRLPL